jgi:hypothetical protein
VDIFSLWQSSLLAAWQELATQVILFVPVLLSALIVFGVGLLIAEWLSRIVGHLLRTIRFSRLTFNAGLDNFLKQADIPYDVTGLVQLSIKWLAIMVFFMASVNILGLSALAAILHNLLSYVPRVITAAVVLAIGVFLATLVEGIVRGTLLSVDHQHAKPISKLTRWLVLFISIFAAIDELQIARPIVDTFFQGLTWTVTLSIGLAVGLGSKDLIAKLLQDWYTSLKK